MVLHFIPVRLVVCPNGRQASAAAARGFASRRRLEAVFGGALLKGLAPHRDWYATEQGLEGHLRLLGNTGSTEFERA